jgi:hypothetical protein
VHRPRRWAAWLAAGSLLALCAWMARIALQDAPVTYTSVDAHFKYGSTGAERAFGMPYWVWRALPELFPEYLPGEGYASLGFIYEAGRDLPIGVSERSIRGMRKVGLNCGACHVGVVRAEEGGEARVLVGMPANTLDLGALQRFLFQCATDARFTPPHILGAIARVGGKLNWFERQRLRWYELYALRERLLELRDRSQFTEQQAPYGPGRVDIYSVIKAFLDIDLGRAYARPVGTVDIKSVWLLEPRDGLALQWDGSNTSSAERAWFGALHTGAYGPAADVEAIERTRDWLSNEAPPSYPRRAPVMASFDRGREIYERRCADCHGRNGRDFSGPRVGEVTALSVIGTDPNASQTQTIELAIRLNELRIGQDRPPLAQFRKPEPAGYANLPLDGLWLRAPYLHNGSVPSVRDLLEPAERRPRVFYRGGEVYDDARMGFVYDQPEIGGRKLFPYYTGLAGNSNAGHEGSAFGTTLPPEDKDALVEYLKSF